jgi:hypothetical protein
VNQNAFGHGNEKNPTSCSGAQFKDYCVTRKCTMIKFIVLYYANKWTERHIQLKEQAKHMWFTTWLKHGISSASLKGNHTLREIFI